MRKANQENSVETLRNEPIITDGVSELLEQWSSRGVRQLRETIQDEDSRLEGLRDDYQLVLDRINTVEQEQVQRREQLQSLETLDQDQIASDLEIVKRTPFIHKIDRVTDVIVEITTNCLFTDIRVNSGDREKVRRNIGAFKIRTNSDEIRISNLTYPELQVEGRDLAHWAVRDSVPCLEDHRDAIMIPLRQGRLSEALQAIHYYLVSDNDSGAWCRSHDWIDARNEIYGVPAYDNQSLRQDNDVVIMENHEQFVLEEQPESVRFASVARGVGNRIVVDFGQEIYRNSESENPMRISHTVNGLLEEPTGYVIERSKLHRITAQQRTTQTPSEVYQSIMGNTSYDLLDQLPTNATPDMASAITN